MVRFYGVSSSCVGGDRILLILGQVSSMLGGPYARTARYAGLPRRHRSWGALRFVPSGRPAIDQLRPWQSSVL